VIRLVDPGTGKLVRALVGHEGTVHALAWFPNGTLVSAGQDGTVRLWQAKSGKLLRTLPINTPNLACSPDGRTLAYHRQARVVLRDLKTGAERTLAGPPALGVALAFSPDGKLLARAAALEVHVWQVASGKLWQRLTGHTAGVIALAFSPDSQRLASGSHDRTLRVWEVGPGRQAWFRKEPGPVSSVAWAPDGTAVVAATSPSAGARNAVVRRDAKTGEPARPPLLGAAAGTTVVAWSPDGKVVAAGSPALWLWQAGTGRVLQSLGGHPETSAVLTWSGDGKLLLSGSNQGVRFWDLASGQHLGHSGGGRCDVLACAPDGKLAALARGFDSLVVLVPAPPAKGLRSLKEHTGKVLALAFAPGSQQLASGGDDQVVRLWPINPDTILGKTPQPVPRRLVGVGAAVRALAFAPDGALLAAGGAGPKVCLWRVATGALERTLTGVPAGTSSLAWSADGTQLAGSSGKGVRLWDVRAGSFRDLKGPSGAVTRLAWTQGGETLLGLGEDGSVLSWDVATDKLHSPLALGSRSGSFSPDGRLLADSSGAYTFRVWETTTGRQRGTAVVLSRGAVVVSPEGPYRGDAAAEWQLAYVVETEEGQETLTLEQFEERYGWKNDPRRVQLGRDAPVE
jgi:WD40 repeat protein